MLQNEVSSKQTERETVRERERETARESEREREQYWSACRTSHHVTETERETPTETVAQFPDILRFTPSP